MSLPMVPNWVEDETLYSWSASFHATFGNGSARLTGQTLFNAEHACKERDAPCDLHHFVKITCEGLGSVKEVLTQRTRIGQYLLFLDPTKLAYFNAALIHGAKLGWRQMLGMSASGLDNPNRMRYCLECALFDLEKTGLARWHWRHQLLGSWICTEHDRLLIEVEPKVSDWILPKIDHSIDTKPSPSSSERAALTHLAILSKSLANADFLNPEDVRRLAFEQLKERQITSWGTPLNSSGLSQWFMCSPLSKWLGNYGGSIGQLSTGHWIYKLLRGRTKEHPLKWLIFWSALECDTPADALTRRLCTPSTEPHWDMDGQGIIWSTSVRELPRNASAQIVQKSSINEFVNALGSTNRRVRKIMASHGGLPKSYKGRSAAQDKLREAIGKISAFLADNPTARRNDVLQKCKKHAEWLRRHHPDVLNQLLPLHVQAIRNQLTLI